MNKRVFAFAVSQLLFVAVWFFGFGHNSWSQSSPKEARKTAPVPTEKGVKISIPEHLRKKGGKLRIKNIETGKEAILEITDEEFISSDVVKSLLDGQNQSIVPEFSVLESVKTVRSRLPAPTDPSLGGFRISKSLVFDQPTWRTIGFRAQRLKSGIVKIDIDPKVQNIVISVEEAARRRSLKEAKNIRLLFEAGFLALGERRYAISLESFERILAKGDVLNNEQKVQAHYGRGVSNFHQKGCAAMSTDFAIADRDPKYFEDISYYRALCFVESQKYDDAQALFQELVKRNSALYTENSRFYLGVVAEKKESFDEAEMAYLDTIDFASDKQLVELAKSRLDQLRRLRAESNFQKRWVNFAATLGSGYDTNVVALPAGLTAQDYSLPGESSASVMGLGLIEIKIPFWGQALDHRIRSNALLMHYLQNDLGTSYDIQAYDVSTSFGFITAQRNNWIIGSSYNFIYSGPVGSSTPLIHTASGEIKLNRFYGSLENPTSDWDTGFKYSKIIAKTAATTTDTDGNMQSFAWTNRINYRESAPHVYGPGLDLEFRPATNGGTQNSYWSGTALGKWDMPLAAETWGLIFGQEAALQYTSYYQHTSNRNDIIARYTASVAKGLFEVMEAKLQFVSSYNYSNNATYKYPKFQINFTLSGVF